MDKHLWTESSYPCLFGPSGSPGREVGETERRRSCAVRALWRREEALRSKKAGKQRRSRKPLLFPLQSQAERSV